MTTDEDRDLARMVDQFFGAARDQDSEKSPAEVWPEMVALGIADLSSPEAELSGATARQALIVTAAAARHAVPVPIAEHDFVASWLRGHADIRPGGLMTAAQAADDSDSVLLPWRSEADTAVLVQRRGGRWMVANVATDELEHLDVPAVLGQDRVTGLGRLAWAELEPAVGEQVLLRGALARSVQMSAAMGEVVRMTVEHVSTRQQFGKRLSSFQAVQRLAADMTAEAGLAAAAVERAVTALDEGRSGALEIAVAKSCVGHATELVARSAHQAHGAIGTTREHRLHRYTSSLYAWRGSFGGATWWDRWLGERLLAEPTRSGALWAVVTGT